MKKFINLNLAAIVIIALAFPQQLALASDMPDELLEQLLPAGNILIESLKWPQESEKIGFKNFSIGDSFNLAEVIRNSAYVILFDSAPFYCNLEKAMPILVCNMDFGQNGGEYDPPNLQDMSRAFGEPISLKLNLILSRALNMAEVKNRRFGTGRINEIFIVNRNPGQDFVAKATNFFSEKLKSQPKVSTSYQNATGIYTKQCIESISRIEKKPISELSMADKNEITKCNNESTLAFLKGGGTSGRSTVYEWVSPDGLVDVTIASRERKTSIGGGLPQISSDTVGISISNHSLEVASDTWVQEVSRIKKEFENNKNNKEKSDF